MLRGEFITANGEVTPNNITEFGASQILRAAMVNDAVGFWVGLVSGVPTSDLRIEDLVEPAIGTNGYARIEIPRSAVGWPVHGSLNGEPYIESRDLVWAAAGGDFSQAIQRLMLVTSPSAVSGDVFALSAPLSIPRLIGPATEAAERTFRYRIYLR